MIGIVMKHTDIHDGPLVSRPSKLFATDKRRKELQAISDASPPVRTHAEYERDKLAGVNRVGRPYDGRKE